MAYAPDFSAIATATDRLLAGFRNRQTPKTPPPEPNPGGDGLDGSLFDFIWRYSFSQQVMLLAIAVASFPLLYATLELPKRIVNDAISAPAGPISAMGVEMSQVGYLGVLCFLFLTAVIAAGLVKMRFNTLKGVVAERLLRRFRYLLISRIVRFPPPYFRRTSQGEVISIVTAEAEPLGGVMGDALAQPVFQAGQMLTILAFLFLQNVWLGLASIALIPLQAWLIPHLQRKINALQKQRVKQVRALSEELGETVAGVEDLRANNVLPWTFARYSDRLGRLFRIRYEIYRRKFFLKFINNFITQLTPFFFFSIGGYLAIQGQLSIGALVAALAAYKDLSAPWKELLAYYNQVQEMSVRHRAIMERFSPAGALDPALVTGRPAEIPSLAGPIELENVAFREPDGTAVLDGLSATLPAGAIVGIEAASPTERRAVLRLFARSAPPSAGALRIGGRDVSTLHQGVIAARVGIVDATPYIFNRSIAENVEIALRTAPAASGLRTAAGGDDLEEALATGNSVDPVDVDWLDPARAGLEDRRELREWAVRILAVLGRDKVMFQNALDSRYLMDPSDEAAARIVGLRPEIRRRVGADGVAEGYHPFDPDVFNPGLAIGGNLLFSAALKPLPVEAIAADPRFLSELRALDLEDDLLSLSLDVLCALIQTFGGVGADHPLLRKAGLSPEIFDHLREIDVRRSSGGAAGLDDADRALVLAVPFAISAEQIGPSFSEELRAKVLGIRQNQCVDMRNRLLDVFAPLEEDAYHPGLTPLENAIFGRLKRGGGAASQAIRRIVEEVLRENGIEQDLVLLSAEAPAGLAGVNLSAGARERIGFLRAVIKRPDVLLLDHPLPSETPERRARALARLRELLPEATIIVLEPKLENREEFDRVLELKEGRFIGDAAAPEEQNGSAQMDLRKKLRAIEQAPLFSNLPRAQLRLLAYTAQWFEASTGDALFRAGDPPDGVYLLVAGRAELRRPDAPEGRRFVSDVPPGRLVGDLSVIREMDRVLSMVAAEPVKGLRIGAEEFMTVLRSDPEVAVSVLQKVSTHLNTVSDRLVDVANTVQSEAPELFEKYMRDAPRP